VELEKNLEREVFSVISLNTQDRPHSSLNDNQMEIVIEEEHSKENDKQAVIDASKEQQVIKPEMPIVAPTEVPGSSGLVKLTTNLREKSTKEQSSWNQN